ncbi:MAG: translocation/assembly module TamB domain-containing protein, partial [bacterium]|nr:translocation/assembly module TamB domain-containing protein [bacterium]
MSLFRKKRFHALFVLIFILFCLLTAQRVVNTSFVQKIVLQGLHRILPLTLEADNIHLNILMGAVSAERVLIKSPKGHRVEFKDFYSRLSPFSIFRGKIILSALSLNELDWQLPESHDDKAWELEALHEKIQKLILFRALIIDEASLQKGTITFANKKQIRFQNLVLSAAPSGMTEFGWQVDLTAGIFEGRFKKEWKTILDSTEADLILYRDKLNIFYLEAKREGMQGFLQGDIAFVDSSKDKKPRLESKLVVSYQVPKIFSKPVEATLKAFMEGPSLKKGSIQLEEIIASFDGATLIGNGFLDLQSRRYSLPFKAENLRLESLFSKIDVAALRHMKGVSSLTGEMKGTLPEFKINAKATVDHLREEVVLFQKAEGNVELNWPWLRFSAIANEQCRSFGAFRCDAKTAQGKRTCDVQSLKFDCSNISLETILPDAEIAGLMTGHFQLSEAKGQITGSGQAHFSEGRVGSFLYETADTHLAIVNKTLVFKNTQVVLNDETRWDLKNVMTLVAGEDKITLSGRPTDSLEFKGEYIPEQRKLFVRSLKQKNQAGTFELSGTAQWFDEKPLFVELSCQGPLPAKDLVVFPFFQEGTGFLLTNLRLKGDRREITADGFVDLKNAGFEIRGLRAALSRMTGKISFSGTEVRFDKVHGGFDEGTFDLNGMIRFLNFSPKQVALNLKADAVPFVIPGSFKAEISAHLKAIGSFPSPLISGDLDITDGKYFRDFTIRELVLKPVTIEEDKNDTWGWLDQAVLDLSLKNSGEVRIENNLVRRLPLRGDLHLRGRFENPILTGAVDVLGGVGANDGIIRLLGARFQVSEGRIDFNNPYRNNPVLDIRADQYFDELTLEDRAPVSLRIEGTLDNMKIVPETATVDQRDFSCLIFYGMTCQEARQNKRSGEGTTVASAVIGEQVSSILDHSLSDSAKPDIFRLEAGGEKQETISKVTVGKSLNDRLSFEFTSDFAPEVAERTIKTNYFF